MIIRHKDNRTDLVIAEQMVCELDISYNVINETFNIFIDALKRVARWEMPALTIMYKTSNGQGGIMSIGNKMFIVRINEEESFFTPIDFSKYNLSPNADLEEMLFILAEEFVNDLKQNKDLFTDIMTKKSKKLTKDYISFKLTQMAAGIEYAEKEAKKKYAVPEFIKKRILHEEECNHILITAAKEIKKKNDNITDRQSI